MRRAALYLLCAPCQVVQALAAALVALTTRADVETYDGGVVVTPARGSWWERTRWSMTWGHAVVLHPDHGEPVLVHEMVHVRQFEARCCAAWIAAPFACLSAWHWWLGPLALLLSAQGVGYLGAMAAAWLYGRESYRDNVWERHARGEQ